MGVKRKYPDKNCEQCGTLLARKPGRPYRIARFCNNKCRAAFTAYTPEKLISVFWKRVDKNGANGCWLFGGTITFEGYGHVDVGPHTTGQRKQYQAHRFAWELLRGPIPPDKLVLHHCDVRNCVNPAHLYLGNRHDNARDMIARGRYAHRYTPVEKLLWPQLSRRLKEKP